MNDPAAAIKQLVRRTFALAENIAPEVMPSIVPIWYEGRSGKRLILGTAFFAQFGGRLFLVTAEHNFSDNPGECLYIEFCGQVHNLNRMLAQISTADDLWVSEVDDGIRAKMAHNCAVRLERRPAEMLRFCTGTVLIGYPELLNKDGGKFTALPISTILETRDLDTRTSLPEPVVYFVNDDFLSTVAGVPVMHMPEMYGMSGGPAFGWYCCPSSCGSDFEFHSFLQGVIVSWSIPKGFIVACNAARIAALIEAAPGTTGRV